MADQLEGPIHEGDQLTWAPRKLRWRRLWPKKAMEHLTVAEVRVGENGEAEFYTIARDTGAGAWIPESKLREMCTRGWE